jgi:cellulose synthase operon protein C
LQDAELYADQALSINPRLPEGLRLKADLSFNAGDPVKALEYLGQGAEDQPARGRNAGARGRLLLSPARQGQASGVIAQAEKQNPKAGEFFYELAKRLDEGKHYFDAEKYYQQALKLRPTLTKVRNNQLGLLYMRLGQEKEARKSMLDEAFKADPFNVRVYNTLKVLKHLEKLRDHQDAPFPVLRYDPKNDQVLAGVMAKYLEEIYDELAEKFQYAPKEPILIQLFNNHTMFSGRSSPCPTCTPSAPAPAAWSRWSRPATRPTSLPSRSTGTAFCGMSWYTSSTWSRPNFLVPHWFTEGLAVQAENTPMPPLWYRLLLERVQSDDLMNLDNVHLGFIRPGTSDNWHLAYLQSKLYVEYLTRTHGEKAIGGMLAAYRDGLKHRGCHRESVQGVERGF